MKRTIFILLFLFFAKTSFSQPKRYIAHGILNLEADANNAIPLMTKMVAQGCNAVELTIMWERIYQKVDSKPYWTQIDNQINHATKNLKVKVALRIHLGRDIANIKGFWDQSSAITDFKGFPLAVYYNNNHFSFAHQASIDKAKAFVKEVCERYEYLQKDNQLLFVSVVNTPQQEAGFPFENQQWPSAQYNAVYDHSKFAMIKLRDWAKNKYTTIRTLNSYWGTTYKNFDEVQPYVNWSNVYDSFHGRRGKDWYLVRHEMLKNYTDQMIDNIKSVNPNIKVAQEYGSVTDGLSLLRNTLGFKNLNKNVEIIKTNSNYSLFEYDMILNNLPPNQKYYTEIAVFDRPTGDEIKEIVPKILRYNCEYLALYIDQDGKDYEKFLPVVKEAVKYISIEPRNPVPLDSMKVRLSQMIDNTEGITNDWKRISENGKKAVKVIFEEDIIIDNKKIENPLPDVIETTPTIVQPPKEGGPNQLPGESIKNYTKELVVNLNFQFRIPENLYYDADGFIALVEVVEAPAWVKFNRFESSFYGKAPNLGKTQIKMRVYDNNGGSFDSSIYLDIVSPIINFELIKAEYFDTPIEGWGYIDNKRILYLDALPKKLNVIARCNLDSVNVFFDLIGPYKFSRISDRLPYNLFGEGEARGIVFPVGTYTLSAKAYKKDSIISSKTVQFSVVSSTIAANNVLPDWLVYPNPFEQVCNIKLPDNEALTTLTFTLFTSNGLSQEVKKEVISIIEKTAYIDLGHIDVPTGNYILEISKVGEVLKRVKVSKF